MALILFHNDNKDYSILIEYPPAKQISIKIKLLLKIKMNLSQNIYTEYSVVEGKWVHLLQYSK